MSDAVTYILADHEKRLRKIGTDYWEYHAGEATDPETLYMTTKAGVNSTTSPYFWVENGSVKRILDSAELSSMTSNQVPRCADFNTDDFVVGTDKKISLAKKSSSLTDTSVTDLLLGMFTEFAELNGLDIPPTWTKSDEPDQPDQIDPQSE
jgi:hypothetical protein